jgi:hypothetical protein
LLNDDDSPEPDADFVDFATYGEIIHPGLARPRVTSAIHAYGQ